MDKQQHTPGPWIVEQVGGALEVCNEETLFTVARCISKQTANARLIAAAPELLIAAQAARDVLATAIRANWEGQTDDDISEHVTIKRLDAAIAKATGGESCN